ncbi:MAG TPA: hypothetical protein VL652_21915 [Kutzneria sp.]|jgi:hypothetical protein|nr:hypothetical protein [Kutzneria sp.]
MVANAAFARIVSVGVLLALVDVGPAVIASTSAQVAAAHALPVPAADDAPPSTPGSPPKTVQGGTDW